MAYITRDHEAGNPIEEFATEAEAIEAVDRYVEEDKVDGTYIEGFYEVYDCENGEVVYIA